MVCVDDTVRAITEIAPSPSCTQERVRQGPRRTSQSDRLSSCAVTPLSKIGECRNHAGEVVTFDHGAIARAGHAPTPAFKRAGFAQHGPEDEKLAAPETIDCAVKVRCA